jgi:hypothetical protein
VKPQLRDNLIYLAVAIGVAGLVWADFFYSDSHGTKMWVPSRFALRAVTSSALLAHFVVSEMRRKKASLLQILVSLPLNDAPLSRSSHRLSLRVACAARRIVCFARNSQSIARLELRGHSIVGAGFNVAIDCESRALSEWDE